MTKTILLLAATVLASGACALQRGPNVIPQAPVASEVTELTESSAEVLFKTGPAIICFYSSSYGDRQVYLELFEAAARKYKGQMRFYKVNVETDGELAYVMSVRDSYSLGAFNMKMRDNPTGDDDDWTADSLYVREGTFTERELELFIQDTLKKTGVDRIYELDRLLDFAGYGSDFLDRAVVIQAIDLGYQGASFYGEQEHFAIAARELHGKARFIQLDIDGLRQYHNEHKLGSLGLEEYTRDAVIIGWLERRADEVVVLHVVTTLNYTPSPDDITKVIGDEIKKVGK